MFQKTILVPLQLPTKTRTLFALLVCLASLLLEGCGDSTKPAALPPPTVTVMTPVERKVTDFEEFTGRAAAVQAVDIRARVSGYLAKVLFDEGKDVKEDQVLYIIDQRPFEAELERAEGNLDRSKATVKTAKANLARQEALLNKDATSRRDYDVTLGKALEAQADERVSRGNLKRAKLNLEFTTIKAPIAGRISRTQITAGNLVNADNTLLTNIVSQDPIYVYFSMDERTLERIKKLIREGKVKAADETKIEVKLALVTDIGYPRTGTLNFVDNKIDPSTGTLKIRIKVANPADPRSRFAPLSPGMFVKIQLPIGDPHKELMVPERAIGTEQGQKFLYVLNDKNEVQFRPVTPGLVQDGLRVIQRTRLLPKRDKEGREVLDAQGRPLLETTVVLTAQDRVIVSGLQRVRPGITVEPKAASAGR